MRGLSGKLRGSAMLPRSEISCCGGARSIPLPHGSGSEGAEGFSRNQVPLEIEDIVDGAMGGNEVLGLALGLEPLHFSLASPDRKMGIFDAVVVGQSAR